MADSVGSISLDLETNTSDFKSKINNLANEAEGTVGSAFKNLGLMIAGAFAVDKLFEFGKNAIELASDLTEVQNVVDVTFGNMSNQVNAWAQTAMKAYGMSELSAKKYASTMGAMLKSMGLTQQQTYNMSTSMADLAADMSSFYNLNQDDAFAKIRAGISGETEPLKQLGINMSVANMQAYALSQGITKSYQSMSQSEQTLLRYNYLMHVTKDAQGDFARTSGSWANQTRLLSQEWDKFSATIGTVFMNALLPVVKMLNTFMDEVNEAAEYFSQFIDMITGSNVANTANNAVSSVATTNNALANSTAGIADSSDNATKSLDKTTKAAEKAAKATKGLSGFDKLNTLSKSKSNDSGSASGLDSGASGYSALPTSSIGQGIKAKLGLDTSEFKKGINEIKGFIDEAINYVKTNFAPPFSEAINKIKPEFTELGKTFEGIFGDVATLGAPLKKWFTGDFTTFVKTGIKSAGTIIAGLLDSFNKVFKDIWNIVLFPMGKKLITDILPFWTQYYTQVTKSTTVAFSVIKSGFDKLWKDVAAPALKLLVKVWSDSWDNFLSVWKSKGSGIFGAINKAFKATGDALNSVWKNFLKPIWTNFMTEVDWLWSKHLSPLQKEFFNFVGTLAKDTLDIYNKVIVPIVKWFSKSYGPAFSNAFNLVTSLFGTFLGTIADLTKDLLKVFTGIVDFITGVFTLNWKKAWKGVKEVFAGIFDGFGDIIKGAINAIIDGINFLIRALDHIKIPSVKIPGIGKVGGWGFSIKQIPKLATGGLVSAPTLAMVGDNKGAKTDPEVIAPLSKLKGMIGQSNNTEVIRILTEILNALKSKGDVVLKVNETELGKVSVKAINKVQIQSGRTLLKV